jgi:hypothetical protein
MAKYNLTLNDHQAQVLIQALDLFSRIGIGQFEEVLQVYDPNAKLALKERERIRAGLNIAKTEAGHPSNGSYGIHHPKVDDDFRVAYDLQQVIRHRLAWDRKPEGDITVPFDKPMQIGQEPLAKIEQEK